MDYNRERLALSLVGVIIWSVDLIGSVMISNIHMFLISFVGLLIISWMWADAVLDVMKEGSNKC